MTAKAKQRITLKEACESFSVSYTSLYEAVRAGDLPAIKPLGQWLLAPADVDAWLIGLDAKRIEESA